MIRDAFLCALATALASGGSIAVTWPPIEYVCRKVERWRGMA